MGARGRVHFIKTTIIGGLVFLVPLVVLVMILAKAVGIMTMIAEPLAEWFPVETIGGVALVNVLAAISLVLVCFIGGLVAKSVMVQKGVDALESKILAKFPGYVLIKGMVSGLSDASKRQLTPVLAVFGDAARVGLEIERTEDGQVVVCFPRSPNPWSGEVLILPEARVRQLDLPMTWYVEYVERFGQDTDTALRAQIGSPGP